MQRKRILTWRPAQWRTRFMMAVLALVVVALTVPAVSRAATRTWIGPLNGDWFTSDNWDPADSIPQADDTVIIPSDASVLLTNETAALTAFSITNATLTYAAIDTEPPSGSQGMVSVSQGSGWHYPLDSRAAQPGLPYFFSMRRGSVFLLG